MANLRSRRFLAIAVFHGFVLLTHNLLVWTKAALFAGTKLVGAHTREMVEKIISVPASLVRRGNGSGSNCPLPACSPGSYAMPSARPPSNSRCPTIHVCSSRLCKVVLKPASSVVWDQMWRALLVGIPGGAIAWGAGSAGKPVGAVIGIPLIGLAVFMILNKLTVRVRLDNGVLSSRSLFERHSVAVSDITAIVPVELRIQLTSWPSRLLNERRSPGRFLDVRTATGSTGIWLNPHVYGPANVEALLSKLQFEPRDEVEHWTERC